MAGSYERSTSDGPCAEDSWGARQLNHAKFLGRKQENGRDENLSLFMVRRRAADAGIETAIGCHTFRATGITAV
jgi:hypothetical protein